MTSREILQNCKRTLQSHYGSRFKGLILYGSVARHEETPTSDLDLLVLLDRSFDYFDEVREIVDLLYPFQLESERLISAKPASLADYESGRIQLYRNAKREGAQV